MNTIFKALNDPTRREILELLKDRDLTAGEIAEHLQISKSSISHHLDLLKQAKLVICEKKAIHCLFAQYDRYGRNFTVVFSLQIIRIIKNKNYEIQPNRPVGNFTHYCPLSLWTLAVPVNARPKAYSFRPQRANGWLC